VQAVVVCKEPPVPCDRLVACSRLCTEAYENDHHTVHISELVLTAAVLLRVSCLVLIPPPQTDPLRKFYTSLIKEKPDSAMALKW
jgi:hypothetical protein